MQMLEKIFDHFPHISLTLSLVKCELEEAVVTFLGKQVGLLCCSQSAGYSRFPNTTDTL